MLQNYTYVGFSPPPRVDKRALISSDIRFIKYAFDNAAGDLSRIQQEEKLPVSTEKRIDDVIVFLNSARSKASNIEAVVSDLRVPISRNDIFWGVVTCIAFSLHSRHWYHEVIELKHDYGKVRKEVSHQVKDRFRTNMNANHHNARFFSPTWLKNSANFFASSVKETLFHPTTRSHISKLGRNSFTLIILGAYIYKSAYGLKKTGEDFVDRIRPKIP